MPIDPGGLDGAVDEEAAVGTESDRHTLRVNRTFCYVTRSSTELPESVRDRVIPTLHERIESVQASVWVEVRLMAPPVTLSVVCVYLGEGRWLYLFVLGGACFTFIFLFLVCRLPSLNSQSCLSPPFDTILHADARSWCPVPLRCA